MTQVQSMNRMPLSGSRRTARLLQRAIKKTMNNDLSEFTILHNGTPLTIRVGEYAANADCDMFQIKRIFMEDDTVVVEGDDPLGADNGEFSVRFPYTENAPLETNQIVAVGEDQTALLTNLQEHIENLTMEDDQEQKSDTADFGASLRDSLIDDDFGPIEEIPESNLTIDLDVESRHKSKRSDTSDHQQPILSKQPFANDAAIINTVDFLTDNFANALMSEIRYGTYFATLDKTEIYEYAGLMIKRTLCDIEKQDKQSPYKMQILLKKLSTLYMIQAASI